MFSTSGLSFTHAQFVFFASGLQVLEPYQLPPEALQEAEGTTSLERAARQVAHERAALNALPEAAQGHALQVRQRPEL